MRYFNGKKVNAFTAIILSGIVAVIASVCFLSGDAAIKTNGKSYAPIYNGERNSSKVAIMINVYEGSDVVERMLDVFNERNVKVTFFVGGLWVEKNRELLVKILENGHEIGSHGYFHRDHAKMNETQNREEMVAVESLIRRFTGYDVKLFAPPSGSFSVSTLKAAEALGYKTIMWSKDTIDWRDKDVGVIFGRETKNVSGGDLILTHPKPHTLTVLPKILDYYEKAGLTVTTVSDCIGYGKS